jgi:2-polyprenyl-6-methoxyphenol hydroxylase-like FAD-dependent oxidoreductase
MQNNSQSIGIIGGGIAGLATAIGLQNIGIKTVVYEAAPKFKPMGAGLILAVNAMRALEYLKLREKVCAVAKPIEQLLVLNKKGSTLTKTTAETFEGKFRNHAIHRGDLHQVLLAELSQENIIFGKRLSKISKSINGHYELYFEDGTSAKHQFIISAEGINSVIRNYVLPHVQKRYSGYTCWRGIAQNAPIDNCITSETWGAKGRFGIVPLTNNRTYWFAVVNAAENDPNMAQWTLDDLKSNFMAYHNSVAELLQHTNGNQILWNDIHDLKPIAQYAFDNIVLIGDAAHATTPNMGQGACMAIEDAAVLTKAFSELNEFNLAAKQFEKKRIHRCQNIVNQSWQIGKLAQNQNHIIGALRNSFSRLIPNKLAQKQLTKIYDFEL